MRALSGSSGELLRLGMRRAVAAVLFFVALGGPLTACGLETSRQYVTSDDGTMSLALPNEYTVLAFDAWQSGWMMGADADAEATFDHAGRFGVEQPFVMMSSTALSAEARDRVSLQTLRESATFDGTDPSRDDGAHRLTLYERYLDDRGYEGQVIRFDTVVDGRSSTTVLAAFLSPDRSAVYSVNVSCSTQCYLRSADEIDAIVDSIELTP